jgi:hypothetical protein
VGNKATAKAIRAPRLSDHNQNWSLTMANETLSKPQSVTLENGRWVYQRGYVLGKNGHLSDPYDEMAVLIPQLNALSSLLADEEFAWNGEMKIQLTHLASRMADEIHEFFEEDCSLRMNQKNKTTPEGQAKSS